MNFFTEFSAQERVGAGAFLNLPTMQRKQEQPIAPSFKCYKRFYEAVPVSNLSHFRRLIIFNDLFSLFIHNTNDWFT